MQQKRAARVRAEEKALYTTPRSFFKGLENADPSVWQAPEREGRRLMQQKRAARVHVEEKALYAAVAQVQQQQHGLELNAANNVDAADLCGADTNQTITTTTVESTPSTPSPTTLPIAAAGYIGGRAVPRQGIDGFATPLFGESATVRPITTPWVLKQATSAPARSSELFAPTSAYKEGVAAAAAPPTNSSGNRSTSTPSPTSAASTATKAARLNQLCATEKRARPVSMPPALHMWADCAELVILESDDELAPEDCHNEQTTAHRTTLVPSSLTTHVSLQSQEIGNRPRSKSLPSGGGVVRSTAKAVGTMARAAAGRVFRRNASSMHQKSKRRGNDTTPAHTSPLSTTGCTAWQAPEREPRRTMQSLRAERVHEEERSLYAAHSG
jgi:hypothetical protein